MELGRGIETDTVTSVDKDGSSVNNLMKPNYYQKRASETTLSM